MSLFHKKSAWEKAVAPLAPLAAHVHTAAVKRGLKAAGAAVGVTLASAAVSVARERKAKK